MSHSALGASSLKHEENSEEHRMPQTVILRIICFMLMNELLLANKITANCLNHKEKRNETANFRCQMSLFFTDMSLFANFHGCCAAHKKQRRNRDVRSAVNMYGR